MNIRNLGLAASVTAKLAFAPVVAHADTTSMTTTTTPTEFTPIDIVTITPPPLGPNGEMIDYSFLNRPNFDYVDFYLARAGGGGGRGGAGGAGGAGRAGGAGSGGK